MKGLDDLNVVGDQIPELCQFSNFGSTYFLAPDLTEAAQARGKAQSFLFFPCLLSLGMVEAPLPLHLLKQALYRVPLIVWSFVVDRWRWDVFAGKIPYDRWNDYWWQLREGIQGVRAPRRDGRGMRNALDPLAKFHINDNTPYMPYVK